MKRNRIDWEKELQKTEEIRRRGFLTSILGFGVAAMFIFGAARINNDASVFLPVLLTGSLFAAFVILVFTLKKRAERLKRRRDEENKENE